MQQQIDPRLRGETKQIDQDALINRSQMVAIARSYNLFVSRSTIHRWANEPDFPYPVGQSGQNLLYSGRDFVAYLMRRLKKLQLDH